MKCSGCGHTPAQNKAKFCSNCGKRLNTQPTQEDGKESESRPSPELALECGSEKMGAMNDSSSPKNMEETKSSKRPNDEQTNINHKKKRKKRKKSKKKKDDPVSLDSEQMTYDLSDISLAHSQGKDKHVAENSSDSDGSNSTMDDTPNSLRDTSAVLEQQSSTSGEIRTIRSPDSSTSENDTAFTSTESQLATTQENPILEKGDKLQAAPIEVLKPAPAPLSTSLSDSEGKPIATPQSVSKKEGKVSVQSVQKTDSKTSKSKKDKTNAKITKVDTNANLDKNTDQSGQSQQELKTGQHVQQTSVSEKQMVFGPQNEPKAESTGSSVDPQVRPEHDEVQQSFHGKGDASSALKSTKADSDKKENNEDVPESKAENGPPPTRITSGSKQFSARERLTINFHAVLSNDFKLDPIEDQIFIRLGDPFGNWETNAVELFVSRNLGKHGLLVEGSLVTSKEKAAAVSIPYKYIVYKKKKNKYEFEFIYKLDSSHHAVNRCLFVKSHLLNEEGDWHQYDDIICVEPSQSMLKRFTNMFMPEQRQKVIQGREIAGNVMLDTMFDLLRSWTEVNLKNFLTQLNQFFQIYGSPCVFEEQVKKWHSLKYDEENVRDLLKQFMLDRGFLKERKDGEGNNPFIQDPIRSAIIMLYVWRVHGIKLDISQLSRMCTALCLPKLSKDDFLPYWTDLSKSVSNLKYLPEMLVVLMNTMIEDRKPQWIVVTPLFHLLKGTVKPFQQVPLAVNPMYNPTWAGLKGIKAGNPLSYSSTDRRALLNVMKTFGHLVEIDPLLARSWICLMTMEELKECDYLINVELLDMLHTLNLRAPQDVSYDNQQTVTDVLSHVQGCIIDRRYSCFSETYGSECLATTVKLLEKLCKGVKSSYYHNFIDIPVSCMNLVFSVFDQIQSFQTEDLKRDDGVNAKNLVLLSKAMAMMRDWINQTFKDRLLSRRFTLYINLKPAEIEMWNSVISLQLQDKAFTEKWRQTFSMDFEGKIKQEDPLDQIEFYCSKIEELNDSHPYVARSVEKCALEAVTALCQSKSEGKLFERYKINWKFGTLLSAIIQKSWPRDNHGNYEEEQEVVIQHLLNWTAAENIFQLHGAEEKLIDKLSLEARERMAVAISSFTAITNLLIHGNININLLSFILQRKQAFLNLIHIDCLCETELYKDTAALRRLVQWREEEVKAVHYEHELVEVLLAMSRNLQEHITVDMADLDERRHINIKSMTLNQFMEVHPFNQLPSEMSGIVTYYDFDEDIREMAKVLHTFKDSYIFKMCWGEQASIFATEEREDGDFEASEVVDVQATLDLIYSDIFQPCYTRYEEIYTCLKNGTLPLGEVDTLFKAYKGNYEELAQDFDIMCSTDRSNEKQWIQIRVQQIEQYHELDLALESAQVIMQVKETLCLQGNFQVLQTLLELTDQDFKKEHLSRIDNDLMQAKMLLVDITDSRRLCLQELGLRRNFVNWVKEALEDINELKVFVDLASISAGDNDLDTDRVSCFHGAVLGYSPMLYELKSDSGFEAFKDVLKKLWRALENDCDLPKKLRDTARHLEWLKTVKESHGSVELSSLSLASAINSKGIYIINAHNATKLSLGTALKLQIPEDNDERQDLRHYSFEDLRELQNKLMLMSRKGDQGQNDVDEFAEIFANVQRLAVAFIALYTAGNPLFRHWEVNIKCCPKTKEPSIIMDFNLGSVVSVIMVEGNIADQLPELCRKMEKCLHFWMDFVDKQRSDNYYLNYYTAEQMVYLCSQLTQQNVDHLKDQVFMMLSFVKHDSTASDLRQAWHLLQYEMLMKPHEETGDIAFQTFVEVVGSVTSDTDAIVCSDVHTSLVDQANSPQTFDLMWNAYMKDMKTFLPDTLDVRSLGRLLEILAKGEEETAEDISDSKGYIQRAMPEGLITGKPNLIICPHEDVLTSCVSIYMSSKDELLPTYDEVLLCNPSTPYEQVELFLRRCLTKGYGGEKIYTLLYGDQLIYEVSSKVENFFERMKMHSRNDYRLVIICSSEKEHSYLPSAFSQHRLHMVPQEPLSRIQTYLSRHYKIQADESSAAAVFKDRMCLGVVSSKRAGVGKSLYIKRLYKKLEQSTKKSMLKCIRLIEPWIDENVVLQSLLHSPNKDELTIFHFDVTSSVQKGLNEFLFKLLVLRYLMDSQGKMWKCSNKHLYVIEILQSTVECRKNTSRITPNVDMTFLDIFPNIFCCSPKEVLMLEMTKRDDPSVRKAEDPLMDDEEFRTEAFQRPYQYLTRFHNGADLETFMYQGVEGTCVECLQMLLMYCGIVDPSWAELRNFAWFLNLQLKDCETSVFCDSAITGDTLQGFKNFVVEFMIMMAKDFATPSLSISDQSPGRQQIDLTGVRDEDLAPFRIRKRWESEPHPYIFFNDDHNSLTFIGFHLQPNDQNMVDAIDPATRTVIKKNIMTIALFEGLKLQRVPFNIDFDQLPRGDKIERICNVLGIQWPLDPDETYELTTDNILKMLAIHMRFRCGIPVIIMGETGCGKTRLIKFLCELRRSGVATENMKLVKVHGGTSSDMIYTKVRDAEAIAFTNKQDYGFDSVLFFDEANTTEAISSIKEVLCDKTVHGEGLTQGCGLQIIAACNPYRKQTDEMIQRLESAGLGYRVRAEDTDEKLGSIPLRQLVYRVQALPPSMIPLVWDFGQLNDHAEKMYIQQIIQRIVETNEINASYTKVITDVLSASQQYMRARHDECSFVSLRDVERCMQAFGWFYKNHMMLFAELKEFIESAEGRERYRGDQEDRDPVLWSLVMAVGVCYHACLENKDEYRAKICRSLPNSYTQMKVLQEIYLMQDLLLSGVPMGQTIAKNKALKENVFMMVICIELRIPLFLVGKPGSSKSLSKTLVADAMQGQAAHSELFKFLKQIHLVSFQCSPHSTPDGIINTFKQCGRFQEGKNLKEYISVVVLDEIGLAEDSPKMPLKTLHPLLEEGCIDDEPLPHKKVGFIGISNWALDPAKMNRGIFVSRGDPDKKELIESAKGICSSDKMILEKVKDLFQPFAIAYLDICRKQGKGFFGLRDYYSLIKMVFALTKVSQERPSPEKIVEAVLRNFSGRDDVDAVSVFTKKLNINPNLDSINAIELVRQNILAGGQEDECRYLLVLTKNYAALQILQQTFFSRGVQPEIIFGSSFPKDQEYTQICRNINRVKICMETGRTVVLLNLQNLYESLYDALNQYYVCLGGQKYVDLGLGTHRVKCRVHKEFRLIVIEEKEVVYKQFPIPLINRLEKHYLDIHTVLKSNLKLIVQELKDWVNQFVLINSQHTMLPQTYKYVPPDVFIGYHSDTCASVVLQVTEKQKGDVDTVDPQKRVLDEAKLILLHCATPDSVVRLDFTGLSKREGEHLTKVFFEELNNSSLIDFILSQTRQDHQCHSSFTEVTTFSRLLTASDIGPLEQGIHSVELLSLQQFDTEHSFLKTIRHFLENKNGGLNECGRKILIIQSDFDEASHSANLIASAKYSAINEINKSSHEEMGYNVFVYFVSKLPRIEGGASYVGFNGGPWKSVHIDDLKKSKDIVSDIEVLRNLTISQLFEEKKDEPEAIEVEDMYTETQQQDMELEDEHVKEKVMDTTALVRSCVQSAVGLLRDQVDSGGRSTRRVDILLTLLNDSEEIKAEFMRTVKRRLHSLLLAYDGNTLSALNNNWVIKEASNIDALQEGGTFRQTLWKRVQTVVIPFLAQLVSVIDRDHNLDILLDTNSREPVKRLWLDIFGNEKLLSFPNMTMDSNAGSRTILVPNSIPLDQSGSCIMPFSWRIRDYLEELWVYALQQEDHTQSQFEEFFKKTPLGQYIAKADVDMQTEFFHRYLQDFISMTMNVTCEGDLELLRSALNCCVSELLLSQDAMEQGVPSLPWVHAAFHKFKNRLQNLSRMVSIEPHVAHFLLNNTQAREGTEMAVDVYAALACIELLEPKELDTDAQRQAWLWKVKRLQVPIEVVCSEDSVRHYGERCKIMVLRVRTGWNRIFSLSLFVEHMLLGIEEIEEKIKPLVLEHSHRLGKLLEIDSDLKRQQPFEAVINVLKACKDGAVELIFRYGLQCTVCMGDPQDPLSLPCDHIYCLACIKGWLSTGQMFCPYCLAEVPEDFPLRPSESTRTLVNQNAQFRKRCNAFFVELVSTVCFKDNSPPCRAIILHLLSFLTVDASTVPFIRPNQLILTKALSPFNESVDKNPVVRSVVLKLLLKYSFDEVKGYLQQHLTAVEQSNILEKEDKTELYSLYMNCLEDSMFEKMQCQTVAEHQARLHDEQAFLVDYLQSDPVSAHTATIDYLQQLARVRMCLDMAARLLVERLTAPAGAEGDVATSFLHSVVDLCKRSGNDWYRVYLIRRISSLDGVKLVQTLLKVPDVLWLFPDEVLAESQDGSPIDQYLVCGEDYKTIREAVGKAVIEGKVEALDQTCEACKCPPERRTVCLLLSLFREVTSLYRAANPALHPRPQQFQVLTEYIQASSVLAGPEVKAFAQALVANQLGPLSVLPGTSGAQSVVVELTVHLAAVLLCGKQGFLVPLQQLALVPANMQSAFLPSMPDDMLFVAQQAMGPLQWYLCPNGHPCSIGECGQPMQTGRCPDCGAAIGGENHQPVHGFTTTQIQGDRTKSGHILGPPERRDNPDMLDTKDMSPVPFNLVRLLCHTAMLLGAHWQPQSIAAIIKPPVQNPGLFLVAHLLKDLEQLTKSLGKGVDDVVSTIHLLLSSLLEPHAPGQWPIPYDNLLSTKTSRNGWETSVNHTIITPQLKHLDRQLMEVNAFLRADSRVSSDPIMKLMFGDPGLFLASVPQDCLIHGSAVWSCRERVSLLSLTHIVEQNDGKDSLPLLWRFLQKEAELRLVKFLPDILALQRDLVKTFQNVTDLPCSTIEEFIKSHKAASLTVLYEKRIKTFLITWNQLRNSLATNGELKIPAELCREDLEVGSDFQVLLPRRQGLGLCSTALVSYLIALHNELVYCVQRHTGEDTSYTVSPADVTDLHVIRYELERDLLPLVLSNCQYSMERGQETLHEYDLPTIQRQILTRFLQGKPRITLTGLPTLVNRHDRNYENILKDVKGKVAQEPLAALALSALAGELQSYSEVCEALSTLEVALGFLAMTGGEDRMQLACYLKEVLQMGDQTAPHILKALSMCNLKHCVALWQLLTSLKSENMLRLKRDPFVGISEVYKKALGEEERRLLTGFFSKSSPEVFLLEMHEFLLLVLRSPSAPDTYRPDWGLRDTLVSYMERKDIDIPADVEEFFPEEICLAHYVDVWKFTVTFKQERSQR